MFVGLSGKIFEFKRIDAEIVNIDGT